ncbi:hypothetical protein STEG23_020561, partial [Scotinomys teguina]
CKESPEDVALFLSSFFKYTDLSFKQGPRFRFHKNSFVPSATLLGNDYLPDVQLDHVEGLFSLSFIALGKLLESCKCSSIYKEQ